LFCRQISTEYKSGKARHAFSFALKIDISRPHFELALALSCLEPSIKYFGPLQKRDNVGDARQFEMRFKWINCAINSKLETRWEENKGAVGKNDHQTIFTAFQKQMTVQSWG
jgi:hypothetical protein